MHGPHCRKLPTLEHPKKVVADNKLIQYLKMLMIIRARYTNKSDSDHRNRLSIFPDLISASRKSLKQDIFVAPGPKTIE